MTARRLQGRPAAPGFACGTILRLDGPARLPTEPRRSQGGADALRDALGRAAASLASLAAAQEGEAGDMLAFQLAMLEDPALSQPAFEAVEAGASASQGWLAALEAEIAGYRTSEDEHFRARAADLADIRDRVLAELDGVVPPRIGPGRIVLATDLAPSAFLTADWRDGGIALAEGSPTSHVALLARARGVPMVVGLGALPAASGVEGLLDGEGGTLVLDPRPEDRDGFRRSRTRARRKGARARAEIVAPALSADGTHISVLINVADPAELESVDPAICDGIGLVRTELLFEGEVPPDEEAQLAAYAGILRWAAGRPVTVRTLDAGGDKPIPGITPEGERNPFLGVRGIRLSLRHPALFKTQLRALARAAARGPLDIMIPMVAIPGEIAHARRLLAEACEELQAAGIDHRRPPLGIMVEVPAVAVTPERFEADFYSIGSNDLVQYTLAAGRDVAALADMADARDPAVLRLVAAVAAHGARSGRKVSLCGEAGGDPDLVPHLLDAGLRTLSMSATAVAGAKQAIRRHRLVA